MADRLGHDENKPVENLAGNTRNGKSKKTLKGEFGELPIEKLLDRHGTFDPQLIPSTRGGGPALATRFCRSTPEA